VDRNFRARGRQRIQTQKAFGFLFRSQKDCDRGFG